MGKVLLDGLQQPETKIAGVHRDGERESPSVAVDDRRVPRSASQPHAPSRRQHGAPSCSVKSTYEPACVRSTGRAVSRQPARYFATSTKLPTQVYGVPPGPLELVPPEHPLLLSST